MKKCDPVSASDKVSAHLNRIKGQVEGITKMYQEGRDCIEIVQQVAAARNALGRVAKDLLSGEASKCSREKRFTDLDAVLKEVFRS